MGEVSPFRAPASAFLCVSSFLPLCRTSNLTMARAVSVLGRPIERVGPPDARRGRRARAEAPRERERGEGGASAEGQTAAAALARARLPARAAAGAVLLMQRVRVDDGDEDDTGAARIIVRSCGASACACVQPLLVCCGCRLHHHSHHARLSPPPPPSRAASLRDAASTSRSIRSTASRRVRRMDVSSAGLGGSGPVSPAK